MEDLTRGVRSGTVVMVNASRFVVDVVIPGGVLGHFVTSPTTRVYSYPWSRVILLPPPPPPKAVPGRLYTHRHRGAGHTYIGTETGLLLHGLTGTVYTFDPNEFIEKGVSEYEGENHV